MTIRTGFTLLEVLLSIALLAAMSAAVFSWIMTMARSQREAGLRYGALAQAQAIASTLRDDVLGAIANAEGEHFEIGPGTLRLATLNQLPGDPPGLNTIQWRQDRTNGWLVREIMTDIPDAKPQVRIISHQVQLAQASVNTGTLVVTLRAPALSQDVEVPLTSTGAP